MENIYHKIKIDNGKIIITKENDEFSNTMIFSLKETTISKYYLKQHDVLIDINIYTKLLEYTNNKIKIVYEVIESNETHEFQIEMENRNEY